MFSVPFVAGYHISLSLIKLRDHVFKSSGRHTYFHVPFSNLKTTSKLLCISPLLSACICQFRMLYVCREGIYVYININVTQSANVALLLLLLLLYSPISYCTGDHVMAYDITELNQITCIYIF